MIRALLKKLNLRNNLGKEQREYKRGEREQIDEEKRDKTQNDGESFGENKGEGQ